MERKRTAILVLALVAIGGLIAALESQKPGRSRGTTVTELTPRDMPMNEKTQTFEKAKELVNPAGFINTEPLQLRDLVGKQVILVDFWTYSCINCQRTLPYLNAWHEKYAPEGLTIVGVHTPEFAFEQKKENVQAAVEKYAIKYPVVLDNQYATWQAYGNRYWPRKYLIDIDGDIVYDHIGEGAYAETERKIQELLKERAERLQTNQSIARDIAQPGNVITRSSGVGSPEVYFGSMRNELLSNGTPFKNGVQDLTAPLTIPLNRLFLSGQWDIQPEYAKNLTVPASIIFHYKAKDVYVVPSAEHPVTMRVLRDGKSLGSVAGADVHAQARGDIVTIQEDRLYKLVEDQEVREHTLELIIENPGLKIFTFTFG